MMKLSTILLAGIALAASAVLGEEKKQKAWGYLNVLTSDPVTAQFQLTDDTINKAYDLPRVSPRPNSTSFDWWYFDAVNPANLNESIVVIFYLTTNASFPLRMTPNNSVSVDVFLNFADGSAAPMLIDSAPSTHSKDWAALISTDGGLGVSGNWTSTGVRFGGYTDGKRFTITVDNPKYKVKGVFDLKMVAPSHYPCSLAGSVGESLEAQSHIGWANTIPDGQADVDFTIGDRKLQFTKGLGYHDQKWGDRPFHHSVKDWYWGHARFGPYSFVWLHSINHEGKTYSNAFVYHIYNTDYRVECANNCDGTEPTLLGVQSLDDRLELKVHFPKLQSFTIKVEKTKVIGQRGPFTRWTGKVSAIIAGIKLEGHSLFQEFHF